MMEKDTKEIKSTPLVQIRGHINNFSSCIGDTGNQGQDKQNNNWSLDNLEPNNNKERKENMSDEWNKKSG